MKLVITDKHNEAPPTINDPQPSIQPSIQPNPNATAAYGLPPGVPSNMVGNTNASMFSGGSNNNSRLSGNFGNSILSVSSASTVKLGAEKVNINE